MRPMSIGQLKSTIKDILAKDNLCHPNLNSKGNMPIPGRNYMTWSSRVLSTPAGTGRPGRPSQLYIRRRTSLMLSDEEAQSLGTDLLNYPECLAPRESDKEPGVWSGGARADGTHEGVA